MSVGGAGGGHQGPWYNISKNEGIEIGVGDTSIKWHPRNIKETINNPSRFLDNLKSIARLIKAGTSYVIRPVTNLTGKPGSKTSQKANDAGNQVLGSEDKGKRVLRFESSSLKVDEGEPIIKNLEQGQPIVANHERSLYEQYNQEKITAIKTTTYHPENVLKSTNPNSEVNNFTSDAFVHKSQGTDFFGACCDGLGHHLPASLAAKQVALEATREKAIPDGATVDEFESKIRSHVSTIQELKINAPKDQSVNAPLTSLLYYQVTTIDDKKILAGANIGDGFMGVYHPEKGLQLISPPEQKFVFDPLQGSKWNPVYATKNPYSDSNESLAKQEDVRFFMHTLSENEWVVPATDGLLDAIPLDVNNQDDVRVFNEFAKAREEYEALHMELKKLENSQASETEIGNKNDEIKQKFSEAVEKEKNLAQRKISRLNESLSKKIPKEITPQSLAETLFEIAMERVYSIDDIRPLANECQQLQAIANASLFDEPLRINRQIKNVDNNWDLNERDLKKILDLETIDKQEINKLELSKEKKNLAIKNISTIKNHKNNYDNYLKKKYEAKENVKSLINQLKEKQNLIRKCQIEYDDTTFAVINPWE